MPTEDPSDARTLDLRAAIEESLERNLDLRSEDRVVAAGREDVLVALAALLPQATIESATRWIDDDRTFASNPERRTTLGLSGQQAVFDEALIAGHSIARRTQRSIEALREEVRQDVVQATAIAFVDVLLAKTTAEIQRDNLRVTRANLDLASTRKRVGTGAASEVYRWQSEEAEAARSLVDAEAELANARLELNRILARPLEQAFRLSDVRLTDVSYTIADPRVRPFLENPGRLRQLRDFLSALGSRNAPELASLDQQIAAQRRLLTSNRRDFFLPDISFEASVDQILEDGGAGAGTDPADETEWTLSIGASIPLVEGGRRLAEVRQAREDLSRLRIDRRSEASASMRACAPR